MTEVHFTADLRKARNVRQRLTGALAFRNGDQLAMTEIASMVSASLAFLATHYGIEQARSIWTEATDAGFTTLENEDFDRQQAERIAALSGSDTPGRA